MAHRDRFYFLLVGLGCAAGWLLGLWWLPVAALVAVDAAFTLAARVRRARAAAARPLYLTVPSRGGGRRRDAA